jgi:hypothetical protein
MGVTWPVSHTRPHRSKQRSGAAAPAWLSHALSHLSAGLSRDTQHAAPRDVPRRRRDRSDASARERALLIAAGGAALRCAVSSARPWRRACLRPPNSPAAQALNASRAVAATRSRPNAATRVRPPLLRESAALAAGEQAPRTPMLAGCLASTTIRHAQARKQGLRRNTGSAAPGRAAAAAEDHPPSPPPLRPPCSPLGRAVRDTRQPSCRQPGASARRLAAWQAGVRLSRRLASKQSWPSTRPARTSAAQHKGGRERASLLRHGPRSVSDSMHYSSSLPCNR